MSSPSNFSWAWKADSWPKPGRSSRGKGRNWKPRGCRLPWRCPPAYRHILFKEVARCCGADLKVVSSPGRREGVLGSVSSAIVHHATVPILLFPMDPAAGKPKGTCRLHCTKLLRHILFPADFSDISERALGYVEALGPKGVGQVTLLNALDVPIHETYPPGYRE